MKCGLTGRSTGAPTAGHPGRAASRFIIRLTARAASRRRPVSSTLGLCGAHPTIDRPRSLWRHRRNVRDPALVALAIGQGCIVPSPRYPMLPTKLALVGAWAFSLPLSVWVITSTPLQSLSWGHAGELLLLVFVPLSTVLFVGTLSWVKKRQGERLESSGK